MPVQHIWEVCALISGLIFLFGAFPVKKQGASCRQAAVKAAMISPLVGLDSTINTIIAVVEMIVSLRGCVDVRTSQPGQLFQPEKNMMHSSAA